MYVLTKPVMEKVQANGTLYCALMGDSGVGKSRLAGSCVEVPEFSPAVYIAADPRHETLRSILFEHREHITPVLPGVRVLDAVPTEAQREKDPDIFYEPGADVWMRNVDYIEDVVRICTHDWAGAGFRSLIIDTGSEMSDRILGEVAKKGYKTGGKDQYGQQRHTVDMRASAEAQDIAVRHRLVAGPNQPDYGLAQKIIENSMLRPLSMQRIHVITTWHIDINTEARIAGPKSVGKALIPVIPKYFDMKFGVRVDEQGPGKPAKRWVETDKWKAAGSWDVAGGLRHGYTSRKLLPPRIDLQENPSHFWRQVWDVAQTLEPKPESPSA